MICQINLFKYITNIICFNLNVYLNGIEFVNSWSEVVWVSSERDPQLR